MGFQKPDHLDVGVRDLDQALRHQQAALALRQDQLAGGVDLVAKLHERRNRY
ncbi:hypothetical protein D3C86_1951850 [compost metagenome]